MNSTAAPREPMSHARLGRPLRIAHFTMGRCNPDSANGIDRVVFHLSRTQAALGHDVAVFSLTDKPPIEIPGVRVSVYPNRFALPAWLGARAQDLLRSRSPMNLPRRLVSDVSGWHPDVLHLHFVHVPQNIRLARHLARQHVPYCVTIHGGLAPNSLRRRRWRKMVFAALAERAYLQRAAFLHTIDQDDVDGLRSYGVTNRIVQAPNGIDLDLLPRVSQPDALVALMPSLRGKRIFLYVGRLDPEQKGLDLLPPALARLERRDVALVFVGPDWRGNQETLAAGARQSGVAEQVFFTGPAFGQRKADLLEGADVFVHPSRWDVSPTSVLEAAGSGKPCLLTSASDPAHVLERAGGALVVEPTVDGVAAGLRRFASMDRGELERMGQVARAAIAERLSWRPIAETLLDAYRQYAIVHA